ncbi:MAG: sensor signal transduction histidine kinase [Paenibacillus sp.]|nr:sensor signal transduction histidine kinase [Paenibacillus sp.]
MQQYNRVEELLALQSISEILNRSNDTAEMLQTVLLKLMEVTGLTTGWIFIAHEEPHYTFIANHGLPEALSWGDGTPMCQGRCWCLDRLWDGRLSYASNIISCKRIENAQRNKWGDTEDIEHHASVPLRAGEELIGILNMAAPGKKHFSNEELTLLHTVANQIGSAIKRTLLFQSERKRADRMVRWNEASRFISEAIETGLHPEQIVLGVGASFGWPNTVLFLHDGQELYLRARYCEGTSVSEGIRMSLLDENPVSSAYIKANTVLLIHNKKLYKELEAVGVRPFQSALAAPLYRDDAVFGVLLVTGEQPRQFDQLDAEMLEALSAQLALSMDRAKLLLQRRELVKQEERQRLARDLHDSVTQTLFSLTLTARGAVSLTGDNSALLNNTLQDIHDLSQHALKEMRSLIAKLRPPGLEQGLATGLTRYGERLGLRIKSNVIGLVELPQTVEEALWRIGQEALNNVSKHGQVKEATLTLAYKKDSVRLEVSDQGIGFAPGGTVREAGVEPHSGIGLASMRERSALLGGFTHILSHPQGGTVVAVDIPFIRSEQSE